MLEPQDIQKLIEVLATKEDIRAVSDRVGSLESGVKDISDRVGSLEISINTVGERVSSLETRFIVMEEKMISIDDRLTLMEEKQDRVITLLDNMIGRLEMLHQEYLVLKERDSRYERWFHEIAQKVGITLTP